MALTSTNKATCSDHISLGNECRERGCVTLTSTNEARNSDQMSFGNECVDKNRFCFGSHHVIVLHFCT
jgi:hypothetical protein